jgi:YD repeat-containing protein
MIMQLQSYLNELKKRISFKAILIFKIAILLFAQNLFSQVSAEYSVNTGSGGNPGGINTQGDAYVSTTGAQNWTSLTFGSMSPSSVTMMGTNKWSNVIIIPFDFYFYGARVPSCVATLNGLLSFTTTNAGTSAPSGNNTALPSSVLPDKTIACFWDFYPGKDAGDWVYVRTFGTAPNRQLWIKWHSMKTSMPVSSNNGYALVLEETSNKIYMVDLYKNSTTPVSATIGMQYNSTNYYNYSSAQTLSSATTAYSNNLYYSFSPSRLAYSSLEYDYNDLHASLPLRGYMVPDQDEPCASPNQLENATLKVMIDLGDEYQYGSNAFSTSLTLNIKGYNSSRTEILSATGNGLIKQLDISETAPEKLYYVDITDFNTSYSYTDLDLISFSVVSASLSPILEHGLRLRAWIETEYKVGVSNLTSSSTTVNLLQASSTVSSANPVQFNWSSGCDELPYIEFQLLRLYNDDEYYAINEVHVSEVDWGKALSIISDGNETSLTINVNEGSGFYAWRVRPIGNYEEGDVANSSNWGEWSDHTLAEQGVSYDSKTAAASNYVFYFEQPENDKNWIYNRAFTEDTRMVENMTYADQLLRIRQSQHKIQSDGNALVGQVVYDYSGRDAVKSLASPVSSNNLSYQQGFLQNSGVIYTSDDFDGESNYTNPNPVDGGKLTDYYSDSNTDLTIPNAEQYPFSQTVFDGSGRVRELGMPGQVHRIGGSNSANGDSQSRTVKNYYASVTDDELIRVFANEAPKSGNLRKIITTDPNKLTAITYQTVEGKVIATCLSGESGLTEAVDYTVTPVSKEITHNSQLDDYTFVKEETLPPFFEPSDMSVNYTLTPDQIEADCGSFCSTCDYTVEVYVKNTETFATVGSWSLSYGPASCGVLSDTSIGEQSLTVDPGTYLVGRTIRVNNTNSTTLANYLDEHLEEVENDLEANIETAYAALYALLEAGDLNGFYALLVSDYGILETELEDGNSITLNEGCCPVTFTVEKCTLPCEEDTPDFESMLYRKWGAQYGYTPNQYFGGIYENNITGYNQATIEFGDMSTITIGGDDCVASITLQVEITYQDGSTDILDLLDGENTCLNVSGTSAYDIISALLDIVSSGPNGIFSFSMSGIPMNTLTIVVNRGLGAPINARIICESQGFTTTVTQDDLSAIYTETYGGDGYGLWNAMIGHMINGVGTDPVTYSCDSLWYIWNSLVESWESLYYDETGEATDFDLREAFLNAAGKQYSSISNLRTGYYNGYTDGTTALCDEYYGYGYDEYAFMSFRFDTTCTMSPGSLGDYQGCIDMTTDASIGIYDTPFVVDGAISWTADNRFEDAEDKTWENFYQCIYGTDNLASFDNLVLDCDNADADCINSMVASIEESCNDNCEDRYDAFVQEARQAFIESGIAYNDADLDCIASLMVEECKNFCTLTISYDDLDASGTFNIGDQAYYVGTDQERQNITNALTAGIDLTVGGTCASDYTNVSSPVEYFSETVAGDLNDYLERLRLFGTSSITRQEIITQFKQLYFTFSGTVFKCAIANPAATYLIGPLSNFEVNSSDKLVFNYMGGSVIIYNFECNPSRQCQVCYKWTTVDFTDLVQNTLELISCEENGTDNIRASFDTWFSTCKYLETESFENSYETTCASADNIDDVLTYSYDIAYHHYTLYYYDRVGNLIKTVPPKGITADTTGADHYPYTSRGQLTSYDYATTYNYNSLGLLISKTTPDGGTTNYYYNGIGQLRFSQNAQQALDNTYSYVKYDALGRSIEAGQAEICSSCDLTTTAELSEKVNESDLPSSGEMRSYTAYTDAHASAIYDDNNGTTQTQQYLLNRISYTYNDDGIYTYYSYDPHGNVSWMIQQIPVLGMKYLKYEYDLISGKVTEVKYNENRVDQMYHRYSYDEDNRLTAVQTSRDGYLWDTDATYEYYAHGPLKRMELGEDKVQGLDYVYTLQGWLKSINHADLTSANDPGQDGLSTSANSTVAPDAFGMVLNYYNGDFNRTGSSLNNTSATLFTGLTTGSDTRKSYYTGIISSIVSNNAYTGSDVQHANQPMANMYLYDDMGRLVQNTVDFFSSGSWTGNTGSTTNYYEHFNYDDNGNITTVTRNGY